MADLSYGAGVYWSKNYLTLDFEIDTSHGDYGNPLWEDNQMLLACWRYHGVDKVKWGSEYEMGELLEDIQQADFVVAHNAKYEAGWLYRCGLDPRDLLVFDTKLAEYVLLGNLASGDEAMRPRSTALDHCCRRRGWPIKDPVVDIMMRNGINPLQQPRPWVQGRCIKDVKSTEDLFLDQRERLSKTGRLGVLLTRSLLTPILADIERNGMALDPEAVEREFDEHTQKLAKLDQQMSKVTGGINWKSPPQVAEFLYTTLGFDELRNKDGTPKRTAKDKPKTDKNTLAALKPRNKRQREFLSLRKEVGKVNAAITKNLNFFQGTCREKNGQFYAVFNQTNTATHRLSSSGIETEFEMFPGKPKSVQFQNLPRVFKPLCRAREDGWLMAEWDGSQLEFRVAVELSQDPQGIEDILSGHDVHKFTGAWIYHAPKEWLKNIHAHIREAEELMPEVTKEQRQESKKHTFKPTYGGKSGTAREQAYYRAFQARYQGLTDTQEGWVEEVLDSPINMLQTPWGMRYYWPYAKRSKSGYVNVSSSVYNYPIQAFATAEIIPIAIVFFWQKLAERGLTEVIKIVNTVHDSVICEIHPDYVDDFEQLAIDIWFDVYVYLENVYGFKFQSVPLGTEVSVGTRWSLGDVYEQSYNIYADRSVESI